MTRLVAFIAACAIPALAAARQNPPPPANRANPATPVNPVNPVNLSEHVTVTGQAEAVPFETLARTVVVVTHEEIARLPAHSVADVLAYAASVDVRSRGPFGVQSDFALRGATFGQTLVLVDGLRINDAQSGHHNGDIPVPLDAIDRIEVLLGPGSSLYGADAFGGTINVITRRDGVRRRGSLTAGAFGLVGATADLAGGDPVHEALAVSADRSTGFTADRDFRTLGLSSSTTFGGSTRLWVSHLRKDFGAAGFYGPAPSTERTRQTLVALAGPAAAWHGWTVGWQAAYRTHRDEFLYDSTRPGSPNRHRTHAVDADARLQRRLGASTHLTLGGEAGADWIRSNTLGDHQVARGSLFTEIQQRLGATTFVYPGLRLDGYSTFGRAWSPSLAAVTWLGARVKLHASAAHAFRVPTFTERFYVDPNNLGTPTLAPERAWSGEAGVDWVAAPGWTAGLTIFDRRERETIDFVRASAQERWRAANVRRVATGGAELSVRRALGGTRLSAQYTWLEASTDSLPLLSKYVLQYARHSFDANASLPLPGAFDLGGRVDWKVRHDGQRYWLVDARVGRRMRQVTVFVEGSNLLDARYQEIAGVDMPGRWLRAGLTVAAP